MAAVFERIVRPERNAHYGTHLSLLTASQAAKIFTSVGVEQSQMSCGELDEDN